MEAKDMQKFLDDCPISVTNSIQGCATVVAAKMISDTLNRQAAATEKTLEATMMMAGATTEMAKRMSKSLDDVDEADKWKTDEDDG